MPPESDVPGNEPKLELPSIGFGRKRKRSKDPEQAAPATAEGEAPTTGDDGIAPPAGTPAAPARPAAPRAPAAPPPPARTPGAGPTPPRPPARPPARPISTTPTAAASPTTPVAPAPPRPAPPRPSAAKPPTTRPPVDVPAADPAAGHPPHAARTVDHDESPTDPLAQAGAALDAKAARKTERDAARERRHEQKAAAREAAAARKQASAQARNQERARLTEEQDAEPGPAPAEAARPAREPRKRKQRQKRELADPAEALVARLPAIKPVYAAIISGALSGVAVVLLALGASRGCEAVRDTSSCGGGVGLLATVALLAIEVMIGANLLKAWQISDPVSTSFLGVGVVATIAMLTFLDQIDSPWMLLVIPAMTAAAFALSWWVTVRFVDEHPMASEIDAERGEPDFADEGSVAGDEDSRP